MKVLNISRYLPIEGFPVMNDITLKIYADLRDKYGVKSLFVMPLGHIPKWFTSLKYSLKNRYKIIHNKHYIDKQYNIPIYFFEGFFGFFSKVIGYDRFSDLKLQFPLYNKSLFKFVKTFKPDLVHAHTVQDAFYAYKIYIKFGIPYIITLRGSFHNLYKSKLIGKVLNNAKKIITPSARLKRDLDDLFSIELVAHGVDNEWYLDSKKDFDDSSLNIITVASLIEMKNIQIVIQSVANLINKGYKINYSIVGEGVYKKHLNELVLENKIKDHVTFHGFLSHEKIRELYKENDIFIMLSYPETFGRVYFEAAAQGLLIVGRNGTGMDGYFTAEEAFTIEASVEETMQVLKRINKTLFKKMTTRSRKKITDFKNDRIIKRYFSILENALNI